MGTLSEATGGAGGNPNNPGAKDQNIYENRAGTKKLIRVVTVIAYLFSVSFVAIVLSAYYVFLWQPPNPRLVHRSQKMDKLQADYLSESQPHNKNNNNNNNNNNYNNHKKNNNNNHKKNVGEVFGSINDFHRDLIRLHSIDKIETNSNKNSVKNNNQKYVKSVNTIKLRNPIIEKIYHESDKVTTTSDLQTSIYDIINKHLDPSNDDKKTTDKSTVFTKIENTTETTVLLTPSTEMNKYYEKDENNFTSTSTSTPTPTTKIEFLNKIFDKNRQPPENNQLNTEITTDESNYQTTENLYFQELNEDKTSSNGTEFMNKLKSMYTTSNDKENLQDPIRVETTVELTSTTDSFISIVQEETSKSYDADIDKSVLPER
ncbi:GSCOCG00008349001-RA-CDS [Cotesia congregata]|nr:GSCOCG00008349001-RA-CDS [Cotesia congregata]